MAVGAFIKEDGTPWLTHSKEHLLQDILANKKRFWAFPNCAFVTEIHTSPTGLKQQVIWLSGGDLAEIKAMEPTIAEFGRKNGCHRQLGNGREGWLRVFEGYYKVGVRKAKDL